MSQISQIATLPRPGAEVTQQIRNPNTTVVRSSLPPVIMAPAYEVVEPVLDDGTLNSEAIYSDDNGYSYRNLLASTIYQTEFGGGHVTSATGGLTNVKAGLVEILREELRAWILYGGLTSLRELAEYDTGEMTSILRGYLTSHHIATRPYVVGTVDLSGGGFALNGSFLSVAIDKQGGAYPHYFPSKTEGKDSVITFGPGTETGGTLSAQDIVDQINTAVGEVAFLYTVGSAQYLAIVSPSWGVTARVVIRDTGASATLGFHAFGSGDLYVLGAGYRAKDDGDGDYFSPYVEIYQGSRRVVGSSILTGSLIAEPSADLTDPDNYGASYQASPPSFVSQLYLKKGDEMVADGVTVGRMYQVQNTSMVMGTSAWGVSDVYLKKSELALQTHASAPWAPRYVYYNARNLSATAPSTSTNAYARSVNASSAVWNDPAPARVVSANNPSFPMAFGAGTQFKYGVTVDGEPQAERTHILSGTAANIADLVAALNTGAATGVACDPPLATYGEIFAAVDGSNIRFSTGVVGTPKTGNTQQLTLIDSAALVLFDPAGANPQNIVANEVYTGLGHYSLTRSKGDGGTYMPENALASAAAATLSVTGTKKITINSVEDNKVIQSLNLKVSGDFGGGSTPFSVAAFQGLYNLARALNGEVQTSTSGKVLIESVDGDTELEDEPLTAHPSLVQWNFLGPEKYFLIDGTETGTFVVGEPVSQATTGATGVVTSRVAGGSTQLGIAVDDGSAAFNLTNVITGGDSGATLGSTLTTLNRLAVHCRQDGASNYVEIAAHSGGDALTDSIGFTNGQTVRGVGIRIGSFLSFEADENPLQLTATVVGEAVKNDDITENTYVFLETIVEALNEAAGYTVASIYDAAGAGNSKLQLSSSKVGRPSQVKVDPQGEGSGNPGYVEIWCGSGAITKAEMGLTFSESLAEANQEAGRGVFVRGTGRPLPDFAPLESGGVVSAWVGSQIIRDVITGVPMNDAFGDLLLGFRALRKDITPAGVATGFSGLVEVSETTDVSTLYGPVNEKNPFGLALNLALANAGGKPVYGIGVDDVDADNPEGTPDAWTRLCTLLKSKRVYSHGPIVSDRRIREIIDSYILARSEPSSRGEGIVYYGVDMPSRQPDDLIEAGLDANAVSTTQVTLESSVLAQLQRKGITNLAAILASKNVFIEFSGTQKRWNISAVQGTGRGCLVTVRLAFGSGENTDGFYATDSLLGFNLINADWSVYIRGAEATTLDEKALAAYAVKPIKPHRRIRYKMAGSLRAAIGTTEQILPTKYAAAIYAAMGGTLPPQQGFTNYPISGVTQVYGTNDTFDEGGLDVIAAGGKSILVKYEEDSAVYSRMQLTTDTFSVETQEDSITRVLDACAYFLRDSVKPRTGITVITPDYLDDTSTLFHGRLDKMIERGWIIDGRLQSISVAEDDPRDIYATFEVTVGYPNNRFLITIAI